MHILLRVLTGCRGQCCPMLIKLVICCREKIKPYNRFFLFLAKNKCLQLGLALAQASRYLMCDIFAFWASENIHCHARIGRDQHVWILTCAMWDKIWYLRPLPNKGYKAILLGCLWAGKTRHNLATTKNCKMAEEGENSCLFQQADNSLSLQQHYWFWILQVRGIQYQESYCTTVMFSGLNC